MSEEDLRAALHKPGLNTDPGQPECQEGLFRKGADLVWLLFSCTM